MNTLTYRCLSILKLVLSSVGEGFAIKSLFLLLFQINEKKKTFLLDFNTTQKQQVTTKERYLINSI